MRIAASLCLASALLAPHAFAQGTPPSCQILDGTETPAWTANMGYTANAKVQSANSSDVAVWSVDGGGGLYYWRTDSGDWDLSGAYDLRILDGSGGANLPDRLAALRLDLAYVLRNMDGSALKVDIFPGIYSDTEDLSLDDLYLPVQVLAIQAFNPQMSGLIGIAVYPGFDHTFDPRFGVRFAPVENLRVDVMYPESRVTFRPDELELYAGVRHTAVNEFRLEDGDARKSIGFRETRAFVGAAWPLSDLLRFNAEVGYAFNREIEFKRAEADRDWDEAFLIRVGIGGPI
ncbi:MAG: hypothetical protein H3C50_05310 [Kiritimatiellae bacterium]|nr:hypothetical protein [Kiritimatiellia bacterium]MCO5067948.1 DUF6268 family outer membrane beta-barrel protein [Kiritimatiellia bacterium]